MNRINRTPPNQCPPIICPVCDVETELTRDGLHWCSECDTGFATPREYAKRRRITPHQAREQLIGRKPWHAKGRPIVQEEVE
jgi:hypothetical protein